MSEKIKYWWSEDRQWFCIRIKGETASLTVAEAEELMGEVQQTPSFLALQEEAAQRAVELMEQSRATAGSERIDIVERLRFDATRCELQFSKGVAGNINDAAAEIERLRGLVPTPAQAERVWHRKDCPFCGSPDGQYSASVGELSAAFFCKSCGINQPAQPPAVPVETDAAKMCNSYLERALKAEAALAAHNGSSAASEPAAWLVTWTTKNNGPTASAYVRERDARDAARNVEKYADASNVVVAPAYTDLPQTLPVTQNAAVLAERLIQTAVDYESGRCGKREMAEARAAVEAAIGPGSVK